MNKVQFLLPEDLTTNVRAFPSKGSGIGPFILNLLLSRIKLIQEANSNKTITIDTKNKIMFTITAHTR